MASIGFVSIPLMMALLLFSATNALAHPEQTTSHQQNVLTVAGQVCCTASGRCPGPPIAGQTVSVVCTGTILGVDVTLGHGTTDVLGKFNISVSGLLNGYTTDVIRTLIPNCRAVVRLPLPAEVCAVLSDAKGVVAFVLELVRDVVHGLVHYFYCVVTGLGVTV